MSPEELVDRLTAGVALRSDDAGIRVSATLQPAGGPASKVFPPTYAKEKPYVEELRFRDGVPLKTVLLDAQQSQANRAEEALSRAIEDGDLALPHLLLTGVVEGWPIRISNLTAPHRGPDAYFRDSEDADGTEFDKTAVGEALRRSSAANATAFFAHVPTDLLFGFWDSHRGGRGVKLARCYTSEIIGWNPEIGARAAGRVDPNNIEKIDLIHPDKKPGEFRVADEDEKAKTGSKKVATSKVGHGNIPPSAQANAGVSISDAERVAFLSFAGLNRLRFPVAGTLSSNGTRDNAARAALACLALYADRLAFSRPTLLLRSGCELLVARDEPQWLNRRGEATGFSLTTLEAKASLDLAVARAAAEGLVWTGEPVQLRPKKRLIDLLSATFTRYIDADDSN